MNGVGFMKQVRFKSKAKVLVVTAEEPSSPKVAQVKSLGSVSAALKSQRSQEIRANICRILGL